MEIIETPSYLPPSSLKTRLRWDVFLSFRGEDTREAFTIELHAALTANGVRAFIDNEGLERGDEISTALLEAIEDSAAAVAILSWRYADSWWCLEELSGIFDLRRRVLPVFYMVDPSDVRKQMGPFEADFAKYERDERFRGKVERWRKCMYRVGNLAGYVVVERKESLAIQLIVKKILEILSNTPEHVADHAVGLDSRVETVMRILNPQPNPRPRVVRVLGIHGTPGIGKTTLAKAIYNKLVASFEHRSFVSNVNEILKKEGPWSVQRKIISDVTDNQVVNVEKIALEFRRIIHERRVVIVLDDVSEEHQLSSLCMERDWIHEDSVMIITSRNRQVLQHFAPDVELHEATKLDVSESLELFSYHSLRRKKPTDSFVDLAEKFVSLTGGLPLALQVFGSFLVDKRTREEWEETLSKMELIRPSGLQDVLKMSFNALDDEEKCIFLDISCLLIQMRMKVEEVVDVFEGCGFNAKVSIGQLVKKSLLKINEDGTLWMHDQIRDMGRQIVVDESFDDLGMRSRIWDINDIMTVLRDNNTVRTGTDLEKQRKATRGLVLDIENKELKQDLSADTISQLQYQREPNLRTAIVRLKEKIRARFLSLSVDNDDDMIVSTRSFEQMSLLKLLQINYLKLQGDFKYMPAELRWLKWQGCSLQSLPSNLPRQIRVLDLSTSKLECLSYEVAQNLTVLNLRGCCRITTLPDLSSQRNLKKLILENCQKLTKIPESVGGMSSLIHLNMKDCKGLIRFPNNVDGLKCLKELILSGCSKLEELPDDIRSLKSLQQLLLDNTAISKLPGFLFHLQKLELLSLKCCSKLKCINRCIGKLESLKELHLDHSAVEELPESIGSLTSLEKLSLWGCKKLTNIPDSVGELQFLEELFLGGSSVDKLPNSICSLLYLRVLSVSQCRALTTLPLSIDELYSLTKLDLDETSISQLPEKIGSLKVIKELNLRNCSKLEAFPVSIRSLLSLSKLVLEGSAITELPKCIGKLVSLVWLNLNKCKNLWKLPDSVGELKSLTNLMMEETAVTILPESFGHLLSLKVLKMKSVKSVTSLPASFSGLSRLEEFDARSCSISCKISDDFERLTSLRVLNLDDNSFHSLPSTLVGLVFLKKLSLRNCKSLKSLPPLPSSLLELIAADCTALAIVSDLSNLESLHELILSNCDMLSDVPGIERLKSLRRLFMVGCSAAAASVRQRMSKVSLKKLNYLSIPCGEIPDWLSEEATFSRRESLALTGVLIIVVVSVDRTSLEAVENRCKLPAIVDVQAKIMRLNEPIHTKVLYLEGVPSTEEDQVYLCRFLDYHPLVSMLRDGDKLEVSVRSPGSSSIEVKRRGVHMIYENNDDYDGDEDGLDESLLSVSERLARFFRALGHQ